VEGVNSGAWWEKIVGVVKKNVAYPSGHESENKLTFYHFTHFGNV
jgi:hypothetical protein